jgi:hypothetical protein
VPPPAPAAVPAAAAHVPAHVPAAVPQYRMIYNHPPGAGPAVLALPFVQNALQGPMYFFF